MRVTIVVEKGEDVVQDTFVELPDSTFAEVVVQTAAFARDLWEEHSPEADEPFEFDADKITANILTADKIKMHIATSWGDPWPEEEEDVFVQPAPQHTQCCNCTFCKDVR